MLALYIDSYSRWQQAIAAIASYGLVIETPLGGIKTNPATTAAEKAQSLMLRCLEALGLTPAARARLVKPEAPKDELADFLSKPPA